MHQKTAVFFMNYQLTIQVKITILEKRFDGLFDVAAM